MRTSVGLSVLLASGALTFFASCNPKVQVGDGSECGSSGRSSTFCDDSNVAPVPAYPGECWGAFCGGTLPGPPPPPACKTDGFSESFSGTTCVDHRPDPSKGGEACGDSRDCESVCCVRDDRGRWVAYTSDDAGGGNDASAGADGSSAFDAGDHPDAEVDASADSGAPASFTYQRAWQCSCGRCPSASEVCFALNSGLDGRGMGGRGMGGP